MSGNFPVEEEGVALIEVLSAGSFRLHLNVFGRVKRGTVSIRF